MVVQDVATGITWKKTGNCDFMKKKNLSKVRIGIN